MSTAPSAAESLWDINQTAEFLRVGVETLYTWRRRRHRATKPNQTGPPCARIGKHLRYDPAEVRQWLNEHKGT